MQLFVPDSAGYVAQAIDGPLDLAASGPFRGVACAAAADGVVRLVPFSLASGCPAAALFVRGSGLRVNGRPPLPLTVLQRGDEIRLGPVSVFFTDEAPLRVVPFQRSAVAGPRDSECVRCHGTVRPGEPVVRCPVCRVLYMAQSDRSPNCWNFGPCLSCGRDPAADFIWKPVARPSRGPWVNAPWRRRP